MVGDTTMYMFTSREQEKLRKEEGRRSRQAKMKRILTLDDHEEQARLFTEITGGGTSRGSREVRCACVRACVCT